MALRSGHQEWQAGGRAGQYCSALPAVLGDPLGLLAGWSENQQECRPCTQKTSASSFPLTARTRCWKPESRVRELREPRTRLESTPESCTQPSGQALQLA